ncbi:hypothetical protein PF002_g24707 [Phytophthora fragariae]|uniref:Uncharacterized protein n=1 Tax=Phytophthora fragariae TaxID=53985 RepID=A0A6A3WTX0_9STRA|nr:hypothetical protein PF002_g24707 [Phytophthora fragariae]
MHDIVRILGFEEEEQLVDWPLLVKMSLEILDKAAAKVVQLVIKLIMRAISVQYFVKYELKSHLDPSRDGCQEGFHCVKHAVNGQCDHEHEWSCGSCSALDRLCDEIGDIVNQSRQRETEEDAELAS